MDSSAYYLALDGVTRHGLAEAVRFIMRGALGHAFMPSPPELRIECDKAMKWHEDEAARIRHREKIEREKPAPVQRTQAEIDRNKVLVADLYRSMGWVPVENDPRAFRAAMEAKYGADELAKIPDNPNALNRMGKQAAE